LSPRKLITAGQVAEILGYGSVAYFKRVHRSLEAKGFPKPFRRYPLLWDPAAIAAYQDARISSSTLTVTINPVEREAARLTKRLEAMA
jgi:hypothetical protein